MANNIFLKHHQISFRVIGAWPTDSLLPVFYFGLAITFYYLIFEIWDVVEVSKDLEPLMDNLVSTVGVFSGLSKIASFRWKRRELKKMINTISDDWQNESQVSDVMQKNCKLSQRVARLIIISDNTMNFTYFLQTLFSYIFDEVPDRKFLARVYFPTDARQSPYYEAVVIGQFITSSIHFNGHGLVDGFLVVSVLHACSKIDLVRREIKKYTKICEKIDSSKESTLPALRKLYKKHLECIEFSKNVQEVFSVVSFFHISFAVLLQVLSAFMLIDGLEKGALLVDMLHYTVLTTAFLIYAGYYCICGEYLNHQSKIIFYELYDCYWYNFSIENRKAMRFMLARAQKPVNLTMGKFNDLTLAFFTTIVKTSFSYLSLVRAVR